MDARKLPKYLSFLIVLTSMIFAPLSAGPVQARTNADDAAEAAIDLSMLESQGNTSSLYRHMHSDARAIVPKSAVVGWYEAEFFPLNPQSITEIVSVQFVNWTWGVTGETYHNTAEVTFVQPFGIGANTTYQQGIVRLVEEDGDWRWFFGRSPEFVNEQIARFSEDEARSSAGASERTSSRSNPTAALGCTLVELYPGYPMYRGVLTGMLVNWGGLGDWACLEDLVQMDPGFDKQIEDRANKDAARELGINDGPEAWLWENWMQIEAVRGLPAQCYACVLANTELVPINTSVQVNPNDPRNLAGLPGTTYAISMYSANGRTAGYFEDDYALRARAFMAGGSQLNAPELIQWYVEVIQVMEGPSTGYAPFDSEADIDSYLELGGYTWVPGDAARQDQEFMTLYTFFSLTRGMTPDYQELYLNEVVYLTDRWKQSGNTMPLRQYLYENSGLM